MPPLRTPQETSAQHVSPHALQAHPGDRVAEVRERLRRHGQAWDLLCVVDGDGRLLGTLTPQSLATQADPTPLGQVMYEGGPRVGPGMDQEQMANYALHHGVTAVPVVRADGRLIGVVGPHALMNVLRREHVEDLHRLAGITREAAQAREAIESPPLRRARHRLPWLLVGLAGSALATAIVARFEGALAARPALAFFVPGLVYLADAIGTQSEAVAVRGLSLTRTGLGRLLGGELRTGALLGLVLAALALPMVWAVFGEFRLALTVALALAAASMVASVLGLALPWLLDRIRLDPAYGSGPLATIIQDLLTLLIYFGLVLAVMP